MDTYPSTCTKPFRESLLGSSGLKALTFTTIGSAPVPAILTIAALEPFGALFQSTLTQSRSSFSTVPRAELSMIHGELAVAVNANGCFPRLNTSMYRRGWLYASKPGRTGSLVSPGQAEVEPWIAMPICGGAAGLISATFGMLFEGGCCQ